jgi:hypothetical protein
MTQPEVITIVAGQDKIFYLDLYYADTHEPFDLTSATQIEARLPVAGGGYVSEWLNTGNTNIAVVGAPGAGKISITVPAADSATLNAPGNPELLQDLQVNVTVGGKLSIFLAANTLNIQPQPYPPS